MADKAWVLVTDGGVGQARSSLAAVRALAQGGFRPAVTVSGPWSLAGASRFCARRVEVPTAGDEGYVGAVHRELAAGSYAAILPASDASLLALGEPVRHLVDKVQLAERARSVGIATAPTTVLQSPADLMDAGRDLDYPVVVKPGIPTSPARRVDGLAELRRLRLAEGAVIVQPFLREELHAVAGVVRHGRLLAAVHQRYFRTWPLDCGTACAAVTIDPDGDLERRVLDLLGDYVGIFQAQFAGRYLLDLNPRVYGSLPLAVAAGANLAAVHCHAVLGEDVQPVRARTGVFYRWLEGDLRNLAQAVRERRTGVLSALWELRPRRAAAHSTESLKDPMPMMLRLRYSIRQGRGRAGSPDA